MARRNDHTPEALKRLALDMAREIAAEEGLRGLTVRGVAERMGYAPGTLYNIFANLDDLIVQVNGETLRGLGSALEEAASGPPEARPTQLVDAYFDFVEANPRLWAVLFEHRLPPDVLLPDWYRVGLDGLIGKVADALSPVMAGWADDAKRTCIVAMWASLHGISTLAVSNKLALVAETEPRRLGHCVVRGMIAAGPEAMQISRTSNVSSIPQ